MLKRAGALSLLIASSSVFSTVTRHRLRNAARQFGSVVDKKQRHIPFNPKVKQELSQRFAKVVKHRRSALLLVMADPEIERVLAPLRACVKQQGDLVRRLKDEAAPELDVKKAILELKNRKKILEDEELRLAPKHNFVDRLKVEDLLKRRFFFDQSFAIYGGITGLYDFGPMGCAMKANMLDVWRKHFILEEGMLQIEASVLTPEPVLRASGHVERFSDYMVKDVETGECFRADHLIKAHAEKIMSEKNTKAEIKDDLVDILAKLDGFSKDDMQNTITKYNWKSPVTGNDLSEPIAFNLMFPTSIGPAGNIKGYLRPETAQGMFVNFKRLLEFNQGKLPFAAAQIGPGFRNEISPRQGLIRVREFTMAEIEHFVDPNDKSHPKFNKVSDYELMFFSACNQLDGKPAERMSIGNAVSSGMVANETLGYFLVRVHQYMVNVGVDPKRLRFRQHMSNEMAHYACDCWDAECLTSYGWVECVGNADRSCYDLTQHAKATGVKLVAEKRLPAPKQVTVTECVAQKQAIGKQFRNDAKRIMAHLDSLDSDQCKQIEKQLADHGSISVELDGTTFQLTSQMLSVKTSEKTVHVEEIVPSVIEPAFGIGRIMYAIFEHNFRTRDGDEMRQFLALPPVVAPSKCSVLPLSAKPEFEPLVHRICDQLVEYGVSHKVDDSGGSIGKRYARTDEIGIPFGITVDFDSLNDTTDNPSVTLRDRDSMLQVRAGVDDVLAVVRDLCNQKISWAEVYEKLPKFDQQTSTKENKGDN